MDIGPALAEARGKAGLTVEDVSERTRIRRTIITDIESDNFDSCGGDFYARGHIRAIAKAVGADPVPLIEEYDHGGEAQNSQPLTLPGDTTAELHVVEPDRAQDGRPPWVSRAALAAQSAWVDRVSAGQEPAGNGGPGEQAAVAEGAPGSPASNGHHASVRPPAIAGLGAEARRVGAEAQRAGADVVRRLAQLRDGASPQVGAAARRIGIEAQRGGAGARRIGIEARRAGAELFDRLAHLRTANRRASVIVGAIAVALALLIVLLSLLLSGSGPGPSHHASAQRHSRSAPARSAPARSSAVSSRPSVAAAPPAVAIRPVSVVAFGPGGPSQGDNPQQAAQTIAGGGSTGWTTNWYASARFGNLQSGTGLLLDLGRAATVTDVRIVLGPAAGGSLELRAGSAPVLADLRPVARSADPGGTLTLRPDVPLRARYVLIWFTRLPRDRQGTYQAAIYHVSLTGTS